MVTWGHAAGGDSSAIQGGLKGVKCKPEDLHLLRFCRTAKSNAMFEYVVPEKLTGVQQVQVTELAFAAIRADGSVVTWGAPHAGGDSSAVQDQLKNVQQVQATSMVFAAILTGESVVTWGAPSAAGDSIATGWICGCMGSWRIWWRQLCCWRSNRGTVTNPSWKKMKSGWFASGEVTKKAALSIWFPGDACTWVYDMRNYCDIEMIHMHLNKYITCIYLSIYLYLYIYIVLYIYIYMCPCGFVCK